MTSMITRIRQRLALEQDLWTWRRALRGGASGSGERVVLLCDLVSSFAPYKIQSLFAAALKGRGFRPVVLLPSRNVIAERIYRAAGSVRFVYLSDYAQEDFADNAREVLKGDDAFQRLLSLEIDGVRIGRNVMSLVLRRLRTGCLDGSNPDQRALAQEILAQSLAAKAAGERILNEIRPDLALFNERGYTPSGEIFDLCLNRGIDTIQWLGAPQADRLLFKRYDRDNRPVHPLALDDSTWQRLKSVAWTQAQEQELMNQLASHYGSGAWFNRQQLQEGKKLMDETAVRAALGVAEGRKIAVIFCHILYDATFFYGDSLFADYQQWLVETVRCAIANPHMDWIVKVHPVNVWRSRMDGQPMEQLESMALRKAFGELPPHVRVMPADTDINTWSLFQAIDYGLTVRGTVGMELPCFGIPTVTAGSGRYSGRGFTIDPTSQAEYREILGQLHESPGLDAETIRDARLYAWGTFFLRPVPTTSFRLDFNPAQGGGHPLLKPNVQVYQPPENAEDLMALSQWMAVGRTKDYVCGDTEHHAARNDAVHV